jgi:hypothetical protein
MYDYWRGNRGNRVTTNNFPMTCIPKKSFSQASFIKSSKYFQNRIIMFGLHSVEYRMQPLSCQHRKQHFSKQEYDISVAQEIHISKLASQRWSLEFVISFTPHDQVVPFFREQLLYRRICSFAGYSSYPIRKFIWKPWLVYYCRYRYRYCMWENYPDKMVNGGFKPERSEIPPPPPAMRIGTRRLSSDLSSSTT